MQSVSVVIAAVALTLTGSLARAQQPPELPPQQRDAARLAGLAGFVNLSCEKLKTDQDRFRGAIQAMGVDPKELDGGALMLQARSYMAVYQKDVQASCTRADTLFGREGRIIPGLFVPR